MRPRKVSFDDAGPKVNFDDLPAKVSISPLRGHNVSAPSHMLGEPPTRIRDEDEASDASTKPDEVLDFSWMLGHPQYDVAFTSSGGAKSSAGLRPLRHSQALHEASEALHAASAEVGHGCVEAVLDSDCSDDADSARHVKTQKHSPDTKFTQQLLEKNKRLEEENAILRSELAAHRQQAVAYANMFHWMQAQQELITGPAGQPQAQPQPPHPSVIPFPPGRVPESLARGQRDKFANVATDAADVRLDAGYCARVDTPQTRTARHAPVVDSRNEQDCGNVDESPNAQNTSVMVRNLPNTYTREMLLELLDAEGFANKYDFVYLPIDFKTRVSLAYAFINFGNSLDAKAFSKHFHGFSRWAVPTRKVAKVSWSQIQGLTANIERYRSSPVMHDAMPDNFKPIILMQGKRIPFPAPTDRVWAPQCRARGKASQRQVAAAKQERHAPP